MLYGRTELIEINPTANLRKQKELTLARSEPKWLEPKWLRKTIEVGLATSVGLPGFD